MLSWAVKVLLFLSSYLPLWLILVLFHLSDWGAYLWLPVAGAVLGCVGLAALIYWTRTTLREPKFTVADCTREGGDTVAYIVTYILPFATLVVSSLAEAIGVALLFIMILLVYVDSDMIYVNPILAAAGIRCFRIRDANGKERMILSGKSFIDLKTSLSTVHVTDSIWWDVGTD